MRSSARVWVLQDSLTSWSLIGGLPACVKRSDDPPNLTVTGRRLDAPAPPLKTDEHANNGWTNDSHHAFMVAGIFIPTLGCWQITGDYKGNRLTFVVLVRE